MEIYLVRHTAPDIAKGICYGQADLGVKESFLSEAAIIKQHLPDTIGKVYSSPLQRCHKLAGHLFGNHQIELHNDLMEINCGDWELMPWDDIPRAEIDPWMNNFVTLRTPGGESYADVFKRVTKIFKQIAQEEVPVAIVAHGGVIRSILSHITHTELQDSFKVFSLHYGCVIKITTGEAGLVHEVLSNIQQDKETHKPSYIK